jgi:hypothetical protein
MLLATYPPTLPYADLETEITPFASTPSPGCMPTVRWATEPEMRAQNTKKHAHPWNDGIAMSNV